MPPALGWGPDPAIEDAQLVQQMGWTRLVTSLGNAARKGAGIRVRQPLPAVRVAGGSTFGQLPDWALPLIQDELNVPMQFHAAMNLREFHKILEETGRARLRRKRTIPYSRASPIGFTFS